MSNGLPAQSPEGRPPTVVQASQRNTREVWFRVSIIGAFAATYLGQAIGWYKAGEGAGLIGAIVGAVILLVIWGFFAPKKSA